jgi:hypothetical protein
VHSRFAIFAVLFCGAIAASGQVREQITVEAVDVPVYVFSKGSRFASSRRTTSSCS